MYPYSRLSGEPGQVVTEAALSLLSLWVWVHEARLILSGGLFMRINNLSKIYRGKYDTVKALNDMTLNFDEKGLVFIVGVSGSGKSTLMNMLSGIDKPSNGDVFVGGKSL